MIKTQRVGHPVALKSHSANKANETAVLRSESVYLNERSFHSLAMLHWLKYEDWDVAIIYM